MNNKLKYTLIGLGIAGAVGASVYAYHRYKNREDETIDIEDEPITAEQAQAMVKEKRERGPIKDDSDKTWTELNVETIAFNNMSEEEKMKDDIPEEFDPEVTADTEGQDWSAQSMEDKIADLKNNWQDEQDKVKTPSEVLAEREDKEHGDLEREPVILEDEGVNKLRHDPNSEEALTQFMKMELAEWAPHEESYKTLLKMFEVPFEPVVDGDIHLKSKIEDERAEFFGLSTKWVDRVSYADLILHYSRRLDFSFGDGVRYWVEELLDINRLHPQVPGKELYLQIKEYSEHDYWSIDPEDEGARHGVFQLDYPDIVGCQHWAEQRVDNEVTFDIEFEEYKKGL